MRLADIPLIPARHFRIANRTRFDQVVIHSTQNKDRPKGARDVAIWFASQESPVASAHYVVDDSEVWRCVLDKDVAFAAPGANATGLHVEFYGKAEQTKQEWRDDYSAKMLVLAADLVASLCIAYQIPPVFVDAAGLKRKERGVTTHKDVSEAYQLSTHTDPGPNFPIKEFMTTVERNAVAMDRNGQ